MKTAKKLFSILLCTALMLACFAGCSSTDEDAVVEEAVNGTLTLATSADFPPYESVGDDGEYIGIDIEIAEAIAEELGYELQIENMDFDSIITSVSSGKCDFAMAGLTVTEERQKSVDFSTSYATCTLSIIVPEDSEITSVDDLYAETSYKVGVQLSTTSDIYFSGDVEDELTPCTVEQYTTGAEAVASLTAGKIDAVIIDSEPAKNFVAANEGLKILDSAYSEEEYAIAFAKDSELTEQFNTVLAQLTEDGTIQSIVDKYITD